MNEWLIAMEVSQAIDNIYACERNIPIIDNPKLKFTKFMMKYNKKDELKKFKDDPDAGIKYCKERIQELEEIKKGVNHPAVKVQLKKYKTALKSFQSSTDSKHLVESLGKEIVITLSSGTYRVDLNPGDFIEYLNNGKPASTLIKDVQFYMVNVPKWIKKDESRIYEDAYAEFDFDEDLSKKLKIIPSWLHFYYENNNPVCILICSLSETNKSSTNEFGVKFTKSGWDGEIQ